jgi:hypothetical protein
MTREERLDFEGLANTLEHYCYTEPDIFIERYGEEIAEQIVKALDDTLYALRESAALRGPVPDPETGLVPCGCGGKAKVWPSDLRQAMVTDYEVGCSECAMTTGWVRGKQENAMKVWNTAMGYKEGA